MRIGHAGARDAGGKGGGQRDGTGAKPGESGKAWVNLNEEMALDIGLGWGACRKCGEEGAVSWNGGKRDPDRPKRPSFVPSDPRFDRRHQCGCAGSGNVRVCKGDYVTE